MIWVEKYRPETFDEIVGNPDTISQIKSEVESGNMNHMAFFGPAGTGKTTTANVIGNYLYGDSDNSQFMELNASDERGIDTIRNKVKKFAGRKSVLDQHKIIFLDEADSLTPDAQQALRRVMEQFQESCRFILTGNYPSRLIEAIRSRCSEFEFDGVEDEACKTALRNIADNEGVEISDEVLDRLTSVYSGDLRSQIIKLQSLSAQDEITVDMLQSGEDYFKLFNLIGDKKFMAAKKVANETNLKELYGFLMTKDDIPGRVKAEVSVVYSKYMWRSQKSADREIHVNALVGELIKELQKYTK